MPNQSSVLIAGYPAIQTWLLITRDAGLACVQAGLEARSIAATNMNSGSSRAHTICQLEYERISQEAETPGAPTTSTVSLINLVDLAGSERCSEAGTNENAARMKESVNINKSLTTLGQCIR